MDWLGIYSINEFVTFAVQAHNTGGSTANLDSGSFSIDFYQSLVDAVTAPTPLNTPDTTFSTVLDSKTGLYYVKVQMLAASGFTANAIYFARVGEGTVDGVTPATLFYWKVAADGRSDMDTNNAVADLVLNDADIIAALTTIDTVVDAIPTNPAIAGDKMDLITEQENRLINIIAALSTIDSVVDVIPTTSYSATLTSIDTAMAKDSTVMKAASYIAPANASILAALSTIDTVVDAIPTTDYSTALISIDTAVGNIPTNPAVAGDKMDITDALDLVLSKILGSVRGKKVINAAKDQVLVYDDSDILICTLNKTTDGGIVTWTPTRE